MLAAPGRGAARGAAARVSCPEEWASRERDGILRRMGEAAEEIVVDYAAYLALERSEDRRYEWLDGRVYAMAGGTLEHSALSSSMIRELWQLVRADGRQVHTSDAKICVPDTGLATYADAAVVCGLLERDPKDRNAMTNPVVVVEVLSDSTEGYDRGEKFRHYQQLASLRDYVLVSQHEPLIEVYSRRDDGAWLYVAAGAGASIRLSALDRTLAVDRVYDGIELTPRAAAPAR